MVTSKAIILAALVIIVGLCPEVASQALQAKADVIRGAMESRDFERAEMLVRDLRFREPAAFAANNYDYLLARLVERRGGLAEATSLYLALLGRGSILAPYAVWRLGLISRTAGDLGAERRYLTRLLAAYPSSVLTGAARNRLVDNLFEAQRYSEVIQLLRPLASASGAAGRAAMAKLGRAHLALGNSEAARGIFIKLLAGSRDDYALAAAQGLDQLDLKAHVKPREVESLGRARIYLFNRSWPEGRKHFEALVQHYPRSPSRAEALYQIGFTHYREENHDEAIKWFERVHAEYPDDEYGEEGFYWVATALQRSRRYHEAVRRYIDFLAEYPESDRAESAHRNVVDCFRYTGKDSEGLEWSRRMEQEFASRPAAVVGLFNRAKIELARGNNQAALELFTRLQAQPVSTRQIGSPLRGEAAFIRAVVLEEMGRLSEAVGVYLLIPEERDNYFGLRATERLRIIAASSEGRRVIEPLEIAYSGQAETALRSARYIEAKDAALRALRLTNEPDKIARLQAILTACYSNLPSYRAFLGYRLIPLARGIRTEGDSKQSFAGHSELAAELLFLGVYDEGVTELKAAGVRGLADVKSAGRGTGGPFDDRDADYTLAVYSSRGDHANAAVAFAEAALRSLPPDFRLELLPRDLAELLYPAPYRDTLNRFSTEKGVDPRLLLSLARQESRFNPSAKSAAAARGLLQFIAETANKMAAEEGLRGFELDDVYNPPTAIRLAARYTANLFRMFPNNPYAVVASYNTGEINVERWGFRSRSNDVDRLVLEIAIPETKDYVARVMSNYWAYRQLYTDTLRAMTNSTAASGN